MKYIAAQSFWQADQKVLQNSMIVITRRAILIILHTLMCSENINNKLISSG